MVTIIAILKLKKLKLLSKIPLGTVRFVESGSRGVGSFVRSLVPGGVRKVSTGGRFSLKVNFN